MQKLILLGGGGHCKSCIDVIEQENKYVIEGILDTKELLGQTLLDHKYIGVDEDIKSFVQQGYVFLITVGQIKTASIRKKIAQLLTKHGALLATVVSPRAYVSRHAKVEQGSIIMHDALINASVAIGKHCIINTKALVEHDTIIDDFCHISTSAVINGGVHIKEGTFFGSNAVSKEYIETDNNDFIKAGSIFKGLS
ncbi:MAG TPA: acetyltransferase [Sulfurospirillum arcachonense]|nr:acetyltransferase [Sulfurospirillum arcachonense]HIP44619.1 acetyltransferase [Sulfurospirillum arcachonense]